MYYGELENRECLLSYPLKVMPHEIVNSTFCESFLVKLPCFNLESNKTLICYVHCRGKNVGNLVQKRLLLELQSVCNVHVFTWKAIYISI